MTRSTSGLLAVLALLGAFAWWLVRSPAGAGAVAPDEDRDRKPLRVLFVGNSYTFVNDVPALVRQLAAAAHEPLRLEAVVDCPAGATLASHWESGRAAALLQESHFDWIVLQEQSELPSFAPAQLERDMYPYVTRLQLA